MQLPENRMFLYFVLGVDVKITFSLLSSTGYFYIIRFLCQLPDNQSRPLLQRFLSNWHLGIIWDVGLFGHRLPCFVWTLWSITFGLLLSSVTLPTVRKCNTIGSLFVNEGFGRAIFSVIQDLYAWKLDDVTVSYYRDICVLSYCWVNVNF